MHASDIREKFVGTIVANADFSGDVSCGHIWLLWPFGIKGCFWQLSVKGCFGHYSHHKFNSAPPSAAYIRQ